jgi:signal transduction histidine kinase
MINLAPSPKSHILVVEDDTHLLEGIRTVLELDGYAVETAENGKQALERLESEYPLPRLIVSDIMMPQMSGIELLSEVRKRAEWVKIPFIFLTARSERSDVQRGKQLGVDDYLIKPFDAPDLLIAVESRIKRQEAIDQATSGEMIDLKQRILAILNHEFRTPLTFIVAYADMLNNAQSYSLSTDEILQFLKGVNSGAVRLRRMVENFILLVELETGEGARNYALRRERIESINALMESAIRDAFGDETPLPVHVEIAPDAPSFIADAAYLKSAVIQLLNNAVKFSQPDAAIQVRVYADQLPDAIPAVCIAVQDHGRGISPTERERIWESFYQINRKHYEDQGTGSGLAIVRAVAELHGGTVDLESELGVGSRFSILLPTSPR